MVDWQMSMLAQAGKTMTYFEMLVWPYPGLIGILLWLLSIVMVALCIMFFIRVRKGDIMPDLVSQQIQTMFENKQYREAIEVTATEPSMLSFVVHKALSEAAHGYSSMERAMEEAVEEKSSMLLRMIEWLNLLGNISPMLGLLGTVWGMIQVFMKIVAKGGMPDAAELAQGIGTALVTTLLGLTVAIPSLAVFSILRSKIDALSNQVVLQSQELISTFRPAPKG